MTVKAFDQLACPLDGEPLTCTESAWRCTGGHSFDIAGSGYTHMLPVQFKRSRDPGDDKAMVAARRRFLNNGFYQPIAAAVNNAALLHCQAKENLSCLDSGCGEGYYLRQFAAMDSPLTLQLLGVDISKWAIQAAAKQDRRPTWIVGSNARLPVLTNTIDCLLCLFGFPVWDEFARVLKPGGVLIKTDPGPDHLRELRDIIYDNPKPERERKTLTPDGLYQADSQSLCYTINLEGSQPISDLLAMTPHNYRASAEGRARLSALTTLTVTVEVLITVYIRK